MAKKEIISEDFLLAIEKKLLKLREKEIKAYSFYYKNPFRILFVDLLEGVFKGIGFVIGGTVIIAITALVLTNYFSEIPVVGDYFKDLGEILEKDTLNSIRTID